MSVPVQTTLTSDIQRALQNAVIEVNNAFAHSADPQKSKKKRSSEHVEGHISLEHQVDEKRKKKKKRRVAEDHSTETMEDMNKKRKRNKESAVQQDLTDNLAPQDASDIPIDPQLSSMEVNSQPSATAFLSAIIAAASATSGMEATTQPPILSHSQPNHFLPQSPSSLSNPPIQSYPHLQFEDSAPTEIPIPTLPFSESSSGSTENLLRAVQDLDISKIANVLKALADAAAAANISLGPSPIFIPPPLPQPPIQGPTTLGQIPIASDAILAQQGKQTNDHRNLDLSGSDQDMNLDHAHLLANKWLNASKLAELVKHEGTPPEGWTNSVCVTTSIIGLVYKKGKFSAIEERQLNDAIESYRVVSQVFLLESCVYKHIPCQARQLSHDQLNNVIFAKDNKSKENAFWSEISKSLHFFVWHIQ
jgi:hypothetical protein